MAGGRSKVRYFLLVKKPEPFVTQREDMEIAKSVISTWAVYCSTRGVVKPRPFDLILPYN